MAVWVPPVAKTGDEFEDIQREGERDAFIDIITVPWHDRSRILPCQSFPKKAGNEKKIHEETHFEGKLTTFAKLDPFWLASFLVAASANRITLQQLDLAACKSNDIVVNLFLLATGLSSKLPVPESLRAKGQMLLFLRSRIGKLCRMPAIIQNLAGDGTYDVNKCGAFSLVFQEGRAKEIRHIGGAVAAVPSHVLVTDKFKMRNWPWWNWRRRSMS